MDERFGLFVIIVLGEAVISVASGVSDIKWQWQETLTAIGGFVTAVSLWWLYFECADTSVINQALQSNRKRTLLRSFVYGYSHVLVFAGIVASGVGIQTAIESVDTGQLSIAARTILCGGIGLYLIGLSAVQWAAPRSLPNRILVERLFATMICFVLLGLGGQFTPVVVMVGLTLLLIGLIRLETRKSEAA